MSDDCFHDRVSEMMRKHNLTERQAIQLIADVDWFEAKRAEKLQKEQS